MRVVLFVSVVGGLLTSTASAARPGSNRNIRGIAHLEPRARDVYDACPTYCAGTAGNSSVVSPFICGDYRLGPKVLPTLLPLDTLVGSYRRFDGECPGDFLRRWTNATSGSFICPSISGFSGDLRGRPISGNMSLPVGTRIDRFGSEYGTYVSPAGTPYMQRALPPANLDSPTNDPRYPYNYHVYEVTKCIIVLAGPIAPWFGQPGGGVQYMTYSNILTLVSQGFLRSLDVEEFSYGGFSTI